VVLCKRVFCQRRADTVPEYILEEIDMDRARHEIPLYDTVTGKTIYGKQALFFLIGSKFPIFRPLFENRIFQAFIHQFYQIITYNRRIIAGSHAPKTGFDCAPDFNLFYRSLYAGLATLAAVLLLFCLSQYNISTFFSLFAMPVSALSLLFLTPKKMDFLGHWATIFLLTQLLLLPFCWFSVPKMILLGVFGLPFAVLLYFRWRILQE
jgi:hypothetical protein